MFSVEVKNLGKKYDIIGEKKGRYKTLRDKLSDPVGFFRDGKNNKTEFWALRDVNFNIRPGEIVGVIGKNGAGKSTLLKMLSRITTPTTGEIKIVGKTGSLLEVGTGFHPELSGRENIFLNGVMLGMSKTEVSDKINQVIDFSGISEFIDMPTKYYSSGMYVRLAFSIAAHLETDVLFVDEVLSVGDADFQKRSLSKINELTKKNEKTVVFVSHDLNAIKNICSRLIVLDGGMIKYDGEVDGGIRAYMEGSCDGLDIKNMENSNEYLSISDLQISTKDDRGGLRFDIDLNIKKDFGNFYIGIGVNDLSGTRIATMYSKFYEISFRSNLGLNSFSCFIQNLFLKPGKYLVFILVGNIYENFLYTDVPIQFEIGGFNNPAIPFLLDNTQGHLLFKQEWISKVPY